MSGHVIPLPTECIWCGGQALAETTCPASINCPRCKARPGSRCRRPSGHAAMTLHRERWELAEAIDRIGEPDGTDRRSEESPVPTPPSGRLA